MSDYWFRFKLWLFLHGYFESAQCPNCGKWLPHSPGNWPVKEQRRINLAHWKGCEG